MKPGVSPAGSLQLPTQTNVNDGSVRDAALAQQTLARLKTATAGLQTKEQAAAAGYKPNPSDPTHWINDRIFADRNGYDIDRPATLMFDDDRLSGVMLSHDPNDGNPPDLGAGSWHTHAGTRNGEYASHVMFDAPVGKAFGRETGDV